MGKQTALRDGEGCKDTSSRTGTNTEMEIGADFTCIIHFFFLDEEAGGQRDSEIFPQSDSS